jgi:GH18 family chitinase
VFPDAILSVAVPVVPPVNGTLNLTALAGQVDFLQIVRYDLATPDGAVTGPNTPLYGPASGTYSGPCIAEAY